jgi:hypothetical protein
MKSLFLTIVLLVSSSIFAAELNGVTHPDSIELAGKKLVLNGIATRKATWIKVKVYVGGFYMEKKSSDYSTFLKDKSPKKIVMTFVRNVDAEDMIDGWKEAFGNAVTKDKHPALQERMNKFYSFFGDVKKKQTMEFNFLADGVESTINGVKKEKIKGFDFTTALLSVWFINAKDEGLKEGLLGL